MNLYLLYLCLVVPALATAAGISTNQNVSPLPVINGGTGITTAASTLYVDTTGNDGNACTASGTSACLTIQGAINKLPLFFGGADSGNNATINISAGTFTETLRISGFNVRNRSATTTLLSFVGTRTTVNDNGGSNFAVSVATATDPDTGVDNGSRRLTIAPDPGWTVDAYKGMWIEGVTGTSASTTTLYVIVSNTSNTLDYQPAFRSSTTFSNTSTIRIVQPNTTLSGQVQINGSAGGISFTDMNIASGASANFISGVQYTAGWTFSQCRISGASTQVNYALVTSMTRNVITNSHRFLQTSQSNLGGNYFDYRAGSLAIQTDQVQRVAFDCSLVEGPSTNTVSFEGTNLTSLPKLLNRSGAAPPLIFRGGSKTSATGSVAVHLISIGTSTSSNIALYVHQGSFVRLEGTYVQYATTGIYVGDDSGVSIEGVFSVGNSTTVMTLVGDASATFAQSSVAGTGNTNGFNLTGSARVGFATIPSITATNNVSPDGGTNWFTYAQMPVTLGWLARSYGRTPYHRGNCTLNGASPSTCTFTTYANSICTISPQGTDGSHVAPAVSLSGTTLTAYDANGHNHIVNIQCVDL